jgi:hypothetical protein
MSTTSGANAPTKQELRNSYRERPVIGGIYAIKNTTTGRMLIASSANIQGAENRFVFAADSPTSLNFKLLPDVREYGIDAFAFEVLEKLEKKAEQSSEEFAADLEVLLELWREKIGSSLQY